MDRKDDIEYVGRDPSAATATGYHVTHDRELKAFLKKAMS
jgi:2-oxoglutarate dehydrogenase complex dehydrogenase (E1) component-like enzyme